MTDILDIENLKKILDEFATVRDWTQFHNPKNLSMALTVEAGELLEIFQWMTDDQAKQAKNNFHIVTEVSHELADIMLYLIRLATFMDINLAEAVFNKIKLNDKKYPVEQVKGSPKKYTEYENKETV
jgi:dCTP diphosphatase